MHPFFSFFFLFLPPNTKYRCMLTKKLEIILENSFHWNKNSIVTYWPRPSCQKKKCTCVNHRCIRSKISGDNLDCRRVELSKNVTLARSRWASNYYITPATGSSDQLERRCWNENHVPAEAGPPGPRLSSPERERNAAMARRVGVNMLQFCSVSNSPLTDNTFRTLSNKVRGIIF